MAYKLLKEDSDSELDANSEEAPTCPLYLACRELDKKRPRVLRREDVETPFSFYHKKGDKTSCIEHMVSWIHLSMFSLDVALFDLFHKTIIEAIIVQQNKGVRCRVVLLLEMLNGGKLQKNREYAQMLETSGVEVRWTWNKINKFAMKRMLLIDVTDPEVNHEKYDNDTPIFYGCQKYYKGSELSITNDLDDLELRSSWRGVAYWSDQFETLWGSCD